MSDLANVSRLAGIGAILLRGEMEAIGSAAAVTGCYAPDQRRITTGNGWRLAWMAPDELLAIGPIADIPEMITSCEVRIESVPSLVLDVSDLRSYFKIEGRASREVLAKLCPVDLAPGAFEKGMFRRTRLGQVACAFWLEDENVFHLVCFRSVSDYVEACLRQASEAGPVGVWSSGQSATQDRSNAYS